jgi:hypothetical protein
MSDSGFLDVSLLKLPKSCIVDAIDWLFLAGNKGVEGVALWAGRKEGDVFTILKTIIPQQNAGNVEQGLVYFVGEDELFRISLELYDEGLQLFAQIHSHPGAAYHSDTDDTFPIVTTIGGLSVVVPDFAKDGLEVEKWAVFQLLPQNGWTELGATYKKQFIQIIDDLPSAVKKLVRKPFKFWPWR